MIILAAPLLLMMINTLEPGLCWAVSFGSPRYTTDGRLSLSFLYIRRGGTATEKKSGGEAFNMITKDGAHTMGPVVPKGRGHGSSSICKEQGGVSSIPSRNRRCHRHRR